MVLSGVGGVGGVGADQAFRIGRGALAAVSKDGVVYPRLEEFMASRWCCANGRLAFAPPLFLYQHVLVVVMHGRFCDRSRILGRESPLPRFFRFVLHTSRLYPILVVVSTVPFFWRRDECFERNLRSRGRPPNARKTRRQISRFHLLEVPKRQW